MKEYVLDSNAVLRYFGVDKAEGADRVESLFTLAEQQRVGLLMSVINLGEVSYVLLKHYGSATADTYLNSLDPGVTMVDADRETVLEAARYKYNYRIGYADAFAVGLALNRKATLVSADPVFEKFGSQLKWLRLPSFIGKKK